MPPAIEAVFPQKFLKNKYIDMPDNRKPVKVTPFKETISEGMKRFMVPVRR